MSLAEKVGATAMAVVAAVAVAACSSSAGDGAPFAVPGKAVVTDRVDAPRSYRFSPAVIQVRPGTTVTWTNHDQFPHTVQLMTGPDRSTRDLKIGESVSIRFDRPGDVYYRCSLHPAQMHGKVIVKG